MFYTVLFHNCSFESVNFPLFFVLQKYILFIFRSVCVGLQYTVVMGFDWISFAYAATVASGGIIGYVKAGSTVSLGAGILFGGLAGLGAYRSSADSSDIWLSLGVSLSLGGLMGYRFYNSRKFMPAGLVAILSVAMVGRCLYNMNQASSTKTE